MINGSGEPQLQNSAALANQQQQQTSVKATGDLPSPSVNGDSTSTVQSPSTVVTLGIKQDDLMTYGSLGGIRKPPAENKESTITATQTTLDANAPDDTVSSITGGIRKPPP